MSVTGKGRYRYNSAWAFKANKGGGRNSGRFMFLRTAVDDVRNNPTMWQDWFLGADGIGFGIFKRWDGNTWQVCSKFRVHAF